MTPRRLLHCGAPKQLAAEPIDWAAHIAENVTRHLPEPIIDDDGEDVADYSAFRKAEASYRTHRAAQPHLVQHVGRLVVGTAEDFIAWAGTAVPDPDGPEDPEGRGGRPAMCSESGLPLLCPVCRTRVYLLPEG